MGDVSVLHKDEFHKLCIMHLTIYY